MPAGNANHLNEGLALFIISLDTQCFQLNHYVVLTHIIIEQFDLSTTMLGLFQRGVVVSNMTSKQPFRKRPFPNGSLREPSATESVAPQAAERPQVLAQLAKDPPHATPRPQHRRMCRGMSAAWDSRGKAAQGCLLDAFIGCWQCLFTECACLLNVQHAAEVFGYA